jgi:hypothetical protein
MPAPAAIARAGVKAAQALASLLSGGEGRGGGGGSAPRKAAAVAVAALLVVTMAFSSEQGGPCGLDGLPGYITREMVEAALMAQEAYGHPAGCTIAQIIVESGQGEGLSRLAQADNNLFGMKYTADQAHHPEVSGYAEYMTQEEHRGGRVTIKAAFTSFKSKRDCIVFRSRVFLQYKNYRENSTIKKAIESRSSDLMAEGLKSAGWATASGYAASLKDVMARYGLYRLDALTLAQYRSLTRTGSGLDYLLARPAQKAIVDACRTTPSPGAGLCAAWVTDVYLKAGWPGAFGNACDMYWGWCTSFDRSALEVGMTVAVPQSPFGELGRAYGHVGIYIGDGLVMHNTGRIEVTELETWIATYRAGESPAMWGWPPH